MRAAIGHEVLAGAAGAMSVLGGAFTSPLLSPVVDLGSAAVTAGIAAHAAHFSRDVLRRAASEALEEPDAPLAAHMLDAACRARACDGRALRGAAMIVGRCFESHARGIAMGLLGAWCAPLRYASRLIDSTKVARVAMANAELVRAAAQAVQVPPPQEERYELQIVPRFEVAPVPEAFDDLAELEDMEEAA